MGLNLFKNLRPVLVTFVPILLTSKYFTRPVVGHTSPPLSRYANGATPNFGTLVGDLPSVGRQLPQASDQSFIFRPFRQTNFTINVTVPVAALVIPNRGLYTPTKDVANQAIMLVFGGLTLLAMFAVPLLMTGTRPDSENEIATDRKVERIMSSTRNFNYMDADLQNLIGLNPKSCLEKTICEAHRSPEEYGLLSLPFLLMFPPLTNGTNARSSAPYREAATKGTPSQPQGSTKPCDELYHCYFDVMDLTQYFVDWYKQVMQIPPPPEVILEKKNKFKKGAKTSRGIPADPTWTSAAAETSRYTADQAFLERRIFNVSVPTFTPMFDFLLPDMSSKGSPLELTNQVIIGAFVFVTYIATIFEPMLLSNARPLGLTARDRDSSESDFSTNRGFFSSLLGPKTIIFEDPHRNISTKLGIDPSECLHKSICQAHRHTETYGLLSSFLRFFYPTPPNTGTNATLEMSPDQIAAYRGAAKKAECDDLYHCFFDPLDLTLLVINWWKGARDPDQLPLIF